MEELMDQFHAHSKTQKSRRNFILSYYIKKSYEKSQQPIYGELLGPFLSSNCQNCAIGSALELTPSPPLMAV
jgi:hypothetical protein